LRCIVLLLLLSVFTIIIFQREQDKNAESDRSDVLSLELDRIGAEIKSCRKKVVDIAKDTMSSFLSGAKGRVYKMVSASEHGCELNNMYNFMCQYYRKDSKKGNIITTVFIFSEMITAESNGRDLLDELHASTIPSPPDFSHENILEMRSAEIATAAVNQEKWKVKQAELLLEKQRVKALSNQAKQAQLVAISKLSEEDQKEIADSLIEAKRLALQVIDGQADDGSASSDDESDERQSG
jgi:hypothetical protein